MSTGIPYLGSKISLISKAEIRYEGILYTIDPNESTVALAKVRSFGTEDRPTGRPVPPRDEIFEYIIFRGSDIKDLHVCEMPNSESQSQEGPPQVQDPAIVKQSSRQGTPTNASGGQESYQYSSGSYNSGITVSGTHSQPQMPQSYGQPVHATHQEPLVQLDGGQSSSMDKAPYMSAGKGQGGPPFQQPTAWKQQAGEPVERQHMPPPSYQRQGSGSNERHSQLYQNQQYSYSGNHGGQMYRGRGANQGGLQVRSDYSRRPPRGGGPPMRQNMRGRGAGWQSSSPLKFDAEFDFESSNAQFDKEEIEKELRMKLVIGGERPVNGDREYNEGEEAVEEPEQEADAEVYYNKAKSFFDNISCEATFKGQRGNGMNRRDERKLNSETFGVAEARRGWRGRGGRGRGWGYRGRGKNDFNRSDYGYGGGRGGRGRGGYGGDGRQYDGQNYMGRGSGRRNQNQNSGDPS